MTQAKKGPDNLSIDRRAMDSSWKKIRAVLGGTEVMRSHAEKYLHRHPGEEKDRYALRLAAATFFNQTKRTLGGWVSRPFKEEVKLEDVPATIEALKENIDKQGSSLTSFAREWFQEGVSLGMCHVLIEKPGVVLKEDGTKPTMAETAHMDTDPYWILIPADQVIASRAQLVNGKELLTHLRIKETFVQPHPDNEFDEVSVEQIRVYDLTTEGVVVRLYQLAPQSKTQWVLTQEPYSIDIDEIPLVTFYANKEGFHRCVSPLEDLVDLNIKHWNSQSDQDAILSVTRFPILASVGESTEANLDELSPAYQPGDLSAAPKSGKTISPFTFWKLPKGGSLAYVEHSGSAIQAGQDSLEKLEFQMASYGSEFMKKGPARQTATARALDSAEAISPLHAVSLEMESALQQALAITAKWLEEPTGGKARVITDFGPEEASGIDITALLQMRQNMDLSRETVLYELRRRGVLSEKFNVDDNTDQLLNESLNFTGINPPSSKIDLTDSPYGEDHADDKAAAE